MSVLTPLPPPPVELREEPAGHAVVAPRRVDLAARVVAVGHERGVTDHLARSGHRHQADRVDASGWAAHVVAWRRSLPP